MFVDTHCHLNMMVGKEVDAPLQQEDFAVITRIIAEATAVDVKKIINVGTSVAETYNSIAIAQRFECVWASAGIHPCDTTSDWRSHLKTLRKLLEDKENNKIVAVGETGLDYYHQPYDKKLQHDVFKAHIELALENGLPLIVHVREAADDVLRILEEFKGQARGVNHCFAQEKYVADQLIEWGFYVGIDGPITYPKNESFRQVVAQLPLSSIILETDAPFLPPQQYRGKQNHPAYIPLFAQTIADLHAVSLADLAAVTSKNVHNLFGV